MTATLNLLCAGASQGLMSASAPLIKSELDAVTTGRFGAVGAMKDAFLAGEPCDLMVLTDAMIRAMIDAGQLVSSGAAPLGRVRTGIAVRAGQTAPDVSTAETLAQALRAADSIWMPDAVKSTAGIHFAKILSELGLSDELRSRLRMFPNGATAMREMAASGAVQPLGCTQISEILFTPGVELVAALPSRFELATVYTAAVSARAANPDLARRFIELVSGDAAAALRAQCGFEA